MTVVIPTDKGKKHMGNQIVKNRNRLKGLFFVLEIILVKMTKNT